MKVLMLGWEFPPHISGGLGTACFGLTQGLNRCGVGVQFVVPRAHGDESTDFVDVMGCNEVPLARTERFNVRRAGSDAGGDEGEPHAAAAPGETTEEEEVETEVPQGEQGSTVEFLEVDSALQPYQTPATYRSRLERLRALRRAARDDGERSPRAAVSAETRAAVRELKKRGLPAAIADSLVDELVVSRFEPFQFSGAYGPDLLAEVARYAIAVGEVARRGDFDVIHAHDWMTFPAGLVASQVSGRPLVCHVHASEYDRSGENVNPEIRALEQLGVDNADRIVTVSHYTASILRRRYGADPGRVRVVHNAVTHQEQVERYHWTKTVDEPIVLFLGRVTFQKGPDYFIEAAARVVEVEPKVKFVMSGSGDMLPRMIERAARRGIARHIHFTGFLRGKEVERMYAMADIYVMPSVSEPFGISPLEAMALDVPVIVSRQSGVSEVLHSALKVDFWDVDGLANMILAILKYPALRDQLRHEGRDEVLNMRWESSARKVADVYGELVP